MTNFTKLASACTYQAQGLLAVQRALEALPKAKGGGRRIDTASVERLARTLGKAAQFADDMAVLLDEMTDGPPCPNTLPGTKCVNPACGYCRADRKVMAR